MYFTTSVLLGNVSFQTYPLVFSISQWISSLWQSYFLLRLLPTVFSLCLTSETPVYAYSYDTFPLWWLLPKNWVYSIFSVSLVSYWTVLGLVVSRWLHRVVLFDTEPELSLHLRPSRRPSLCHSSCSRRLRLTRLFSFSPSEGPTHWCDVRSDDRFYT